MEICNHGMDCYLPNDYDASICFRCTNERHANSAAIIDYDAYSCTDDGICYASLASKSTRQVVIEIKKRLEIILAFLVVNLLYFFSFQHFVPVKIRKDVFFQHP